MKISKPARSVVKVDVLRANVFDFYESVFRYFEEPEDGGPAPEQVDLEEYLNNSSSFRREIEETLEKKARSMGRPLTADEEKEEKRKKYRDWRTYQMSDHLPMWVELRIDFGDDYLESIVRIMESRKFNDDNLTGLSYNNFRFLRNRSKNGEYSRRTYYWWWHTGSQFGFSSGRARAEADRSGAAFYSRRGHGPFQRPGAHAL